jgi:uncharacterized protein
MSEPLRIDAHIHLYSTRDEGEWWKAGYEIWEYGQRDGIDFSHDTGTLGETAAALGRGGFAHGVVVNLFSADLFRLQYESALPPEADATERSRALAQFDATIGERYVAFNRWLMETLADVPTISGFVAMDPWALSPERNVEHLREMAERGARGVKLHPVVQKFEANDPRMHPVYQACIEMGLTVLSHTGPARGGEPFAEVPAFAPMLQEFPGLSVVLAHLGGGKWQDTLAIAQAFPNVAFDLSEIIEWTGAPNAPTPRSWPRWSVRSGRSASCWGRTTRGMNRRAPPSWCWRCPISPRQRRTPFWGRTQPGSSACRSDRVGPAFPGRR